MKIKTKQNTLLFIRFYLVKNVESEILFSSIKDAQGVIGISLTDCNVQCYCGASNMVDYETSVATHINEIESKLYAKLYFNISIFQYFKIIFQNYMQKVKYFPKREGNFLMIEHDA